MAIYIDVIWFLNYCIDLLLLVLTAIILKRNLVKWRLLLGAFVSSSPIFLLLTSYSTLFYEPFFKLVLSIVIVVTSFGFKRFSFFIQNLFMFYFISFVCGGGLIALHYFFNTDMVIVNGVVTTKSTGFGTPISWLLVVIGFPTIWYFSKNRLEHIEIRKVKYDEIVQVSLSINDRQIQIKGLIDNGNQLYDPITKKPVMIIDMNELKNEFPKELERIAKQPEMIGDSTFAVAKQWESKISIIPYRGVGQINQFIIGLRPDKVVITTQNKEKIECKNVIIGMNYTNLSADGDFQCILHPQMFVQGARTLA